MAASRKKQSTSSETPLVCPSCGREHSGDERFCTNCGMPLVYAGDAADDPTPAQERARKIDPRYAQGEPVKVAFTRNQAESDLIQNILLEEGIPSITRRTRGFDVPDFLAAGPRDVLVPESGAAVAREFLREAAVGETVEPGQAQVFQPWIVAAVLGGGLVAALIAWLLANGS
jgi:zinc-ribbon domain